MHGQHKFLREGYRTRDGHLIEWFARLLSGAGAVRVYSRPEPLLRREYAKARATHPPAANTQDCGRSLLRIPALRDRRQWWLASLPHYPRPDLAQAVPAVVWNPLVALSSAAPRIMQTGRPLLFDLLDDWLIHPAFRAIDADVREAYRLLFSRADVVTANSEGTEELARSFGRDDVLLLTNGCDPERFSQVSRASGPITVGYVGKIGSRLDFSLIERVVEQLPQVRFVFAGPVLDAPLPRRVVKAKNAQIIGDVPYRRVPALLQTFDVGWVPHAVGRGEVGGDVIKTYEYRAAGLPVLTTPITGARERWTDGVHVLAADAHGQWIRELAAQHPRVPRHVSNLDQKLTWRTKAEAMLSALGIGSSVTQAPKLGIGSTAGPRSEGTR